MVGPRRALKAGVAVCLSFGLGLQFAPAADATFPGRNGQLLWSVGGQYLYLTNQSGHSPHKVGGSFRTPGLPAVLSPSGNELVFDGFAPGTVLNTPSSFLTQLVLANVRTGSARLFAQFSEQNGSVTNGTVAFGQNGGLAFSPDGRTIAFGYSTIAEPSHVSSENVRFLSVATGHTVTSIAIHGVIGMQPTVLQWLANGRLLFLTADGTVDIVRANGTHLRPVRIALPAGTAIQYVTDSPDASRFALVVTTTSCGGNDGPTCRTDIYLASAEGGRAIRLTHSGGAGAPVWSPNGKLIAYEDGAATKLMAVATKRTTTIPRPELQAGVVDWRSSH
jgi:WD40 repeat protein